MHYSLWEILCPYHIGQRPQMTADTGKRISNFITRTRTKRSQNSMELNFQQALGFTEDNSISTAVRFRCSLLLGDVLAGVPAASVEAAEVAFLLGDILACDAAADLCFFASLSCCSAAMQSNSSPIFLTRFLLATVAMVVRSSSSSLSMQSIHTDHFFAKKISQS